jgi:hypothetical protein
MTGIVMLNEVKHLGGEGHPLYYLWRAEMQNSERVNLFASETSGARYQPKVPFFARQSRARLTLLTKSTNIENLLDLDHRRHTILSSGVSIHRRFRAPSRETYRRRPSDWRPCRRVRRPVILSARS